MSTPLQRGAAALSSRRSASRSRLLVTLHANDGTMPATTLAHACGWDLWRLNQVLYGDPGERKAFSEERSPIRLGQVRVEATAHGPMVTLTGLGAEEAGRLRREARWERGRRWARRG